MGNTKQVLVKSSDYYVKEKALKFMKLKLARSYSHVGEYTIETKYFLIYGIFIGKECLFKSKKEEE